MYVPTAFAETDRTTLHDFIEQHSFGLLVSQHDGLPFASHLPLLLERDAGPHGCLFGHMARQNPQWEQAGDQTVLAVFSGPHAYISPTWYESEHVVPTWNYVAVHAYGTLQVVENAQPLWDIVEKTTRLYEASQPQPWSLAGVAAYAERRLAQIVGFRIQIERIEGKWKLNQNHPLERRQRVIRVLEGRSDENSQSVAALMRATLPPEVSDASQKRPGDASAKRR
jgi:transcriptional regulator